jgi:hypothetical protein
MTTNPGFFVVQPDGKRIDYRYKFVGGSAQSKGACEPGVPDKPSD